MERSSGGLSTKIHATCDAHGNPTGFYFTDGQAHDLNGTDTLMDHFVKVDAVLAHKAYDADEGMPDKLKEKKREAVIPPKKNRLSPISYDKNFYKSRHLQEVSLLNASNTRAIATRYDKTSSNFLGAIHLASIVIWINGGRALQFF